MDIVKFIESIKANGLEQFGLYYGWYRGKVLNNNDPEKKGRVLVEIVGLVNSKCWALPNYNVVGDGRGEFWVPEVGDYVHITFERGRLNRPIYHGGWYTSSEIPVDFKDGYDQKPWVRGIKTYSGHKLLFDDKRNVLILQTKNNRTICIDDNNDEIIINNSDKRQIIMTGNNILLGSRNANQPLVLGFKLLSWLAKLYIDLVKIGAMVGMSPGCGPPMPDNLLSRSDKQIKTE